MAPSGLPVIQAVILCEPGRGNPLREVAGLTLLERLMRQLSELPGVDEILIVSAPALPPSTPSKWVTTPVRQVRASGGEGWSMLRTVRTRLRSHFLVVAADLVVDQRILQWLTSQSTDTLIRPIDGPPEVLGWLRRESLDGLVRGEVSAVLVPTSAFPTRAPEQSGDVALHLLRIAGDEDARIAWRVLLDHVEKRTKDLPAVYFDPPLENALVRVLAGTRATPNHVTIVTTLIGFLVAALFSGGWLRLGVAVAIVVEVLDGVDGKLARIKRMTSRVGELEHVLDFFYENSWYLGLGVYLSRIGVEWAWGAAMLMVVCDLVDNLAYALFSLRNARRLDEASPFLRRFRLVGGRRNIYTWLFAPGFLVGAPGVSFGLGVAWAGVTATVHASAALLETWRLKRGRARSGWPGHLTATWQGSAPSESDA